MDKIITIGAHCNVSYVIERLEIKSYTGLFEWFESHHLNDITKILQLISDDQTINIVQATQTTLHMHDSHVCSEHYKLEAYKDIFERRKTRLINDLKNTEGRILFIRNLLVNEKITIEDIHAFKNVIKKINEHLNYKILLVSNIDDEKTFIELKDERLIHTYILSDHIKNIYWVEGDISIWQKIIDATGFTFRKNQNKLILGDTSLI